MEVPCTIVVLTMGLTLVVEGPRLDFQEPVTSPGSDTDSFKCTYTRHVYFLSTIHGTDNARTDSHPYKLK